MRPDRFLRHEAPIGDGSVAQNGGRAGGWVGGGSASIVGTMSDGPSDGGRTARSDAATRLADLLADVVEQGTAPPPAPDEDAPSRPRPRRVVRRRSPQPAGPAPADADPRAEKVAGDDDPDATQPIPVLVGAEPDAPAAPSEPTASEAAGPTLTKPAPSAPRPLPPAPTEPPVPPGRGPARTPASEEEPPGPVAPAEAPARPATAPRRPAPPRRLTGRAVAFGAAFVLLVAAIPALGWVGVKELRESRGGDVQANSTTDASAPGFTQLVNPTATAMVVHRDAAGAPVSATILALRPGDDGGGAVILVPISLGLVDQSFFDRVIDRWERTQDDDAFRRDIEDVIGVSVPPPLIDVTDESLATLVAPVAPLSLNVNDAVVDENNIPYEGPVSLSAEQVGPFLRATRQDEPEIAHMERVRDVWTAWLEAIGSATNTEPIGAANTGIGSFLRNLAAGQFTVETLDVEPGEPVRFGQPLFYVPGPGMDEQVVDAVPFPRSPRTGRRYDLRLLNGVEGATPPLALMRDLALDAASISTIGNAGEFGRETTLVEYKDSMWEDEMDALRERWGGSIEVEQMSPTRAEGTNEDVVITLGSDVLDQYEE